RRIAACRRLCISRRNQHEQNSLPRNRVTGRHGARRGALVLDGRAKRKQAARLRAGALRLSWRRFRQRQDAVRNEAMTEQAKTKTILARIAAALERLAPPARPKNDLEAADAFVWHADREFLEPVPSVNRIERVRDILLDNTRRFAAGLPANNVLLWGARGMGKSSLVKATHAAVNAQSPRALVLVEIHREDIPSLPTLLGLLRGTRRRCLLFCDDLSFDQQDTSYKSLKAVL